MDAAANEATPAQHPKYAEYVARQDAAGKSVTPYEQWLEKYERMARAKAAQTVKPPQEEAPAVAAPAGVAEFSDRLDRLERLMVGFIETQTKDQPAPVEEDAPEETIEAPPIETMAIHAIDGEEGEWLFNSVSRNHVLIMKSQDRMFINNTIVPPEHRTIEFHEWEYRTQDPEVAAFIKNHDEFKTGRITLGVAVHRRAVQITTGPKTAGGTARVQRVDRPAGSLSATL